MSSETIEVVIFVVSLHFVRDVKIHSPTQHRIHR